MIKKHVLVTGATGLVGIPLVTQLLLEGYQVTVLVRNVLKAQKAFGNTVRIIEWVAGDNIPSTVLEGDKIHAVINLVGENVFYSLWTHKQKEALLSSRVEPLKALAKAFKGLDVLISASAVGIYAPTDQRPLSESAPLGTGFLAEICRQTEAAAKEIPAQRHVICRLPMVLSHQGGAFVALSRGFKTKIGTLLGKPSDAMSWVHVDDVIQFMLAAIAGPHAGVFNVVGEPVDRKSLAQVLGHKANVWMTLVIPSRLLKVLLGSKASILLEHQPVVSERFQEVGFSLKYPTFESAIEDLWAKSLDHHLTQLQRIPGSPQEVFAFFSDPNNLEKLTPPWLNFRVVACSTPQIESGTLIDYRLSLHGVPLKWRTLIERWDMPYSFVDVQLRGPYRKWHHVHQFVEVSGPVKGSSYTLMLDQVRYQLPKGTDWIGSSYVKFDVQRIFRYRYDQIKKLFLEP